MNQSILILGGSKFIGKKIKEVLFQKGYDIYTLNRGNILEENPKIKNIICDREDPNQMKKVMAGYKFNYIVDVSGLNAGHIRIVSQAIDLNTIEKYVFISSSAVYDLDNCSIPITEDSPLGENKYWKTYGTDKIEAEKILQDIFQNKKKSLVILRPSYIYGEFNYAQRESYIFNSIVNEIPIILPGKGKSKLQFTYTKDLADIVHFMLLEELDENYIFNVGSHTVTMEKWVDNCMEIVGSKTDVFTHKLKENENERDFFSFYEYDNVLDTARLDSIFKKKAVSFKKGLEDSFQWYLAERSRLKFNENMISNSKKIAKDIFKDSN